MIGRIGSAIDTELELASASNSKLHGTAMDVLLHVISALPAAFGIYDRLSYMNTDLDVEENDRST